MRANRLILILLVLLAIAPGVMAAEDKFSVRTVNSSSNSIFYWETAVYELTITNNQENTKSYSWSVNPVEWVMDSRNSAVIEAGETETFEVLLRPKPSNFRGPGFYELPFNINTGDGSVKEIITVNIKSTTQAGLEYLPSVALGASIADEIDPRDQANLQVLVRNRNIKQLDGLRISIEGDHFDRVEEVDLAGLEEKTINYRFPLDGSTQPGTYDLRIRVIYANGTIAEVKDSYEIIAYSETKRDLLEQRKLFQRIQVLDITNEANVARSIPAELQIPWYQALFTNVDVEANDYERRSRKEYLFNVDAGESVTVTIHQNYTILPVIAIIVIAALILYFTLRSPIVLKKQIIVTGKDEEGTSEMKVRIYIRNRTAKSYYNLRLLDKTPTIAHVLPPSGLGVMEPDKIITTERKGTIIKWDFDSLEAYEERIVTYAITSKLKIIGNLGLPAAKIKFENAKGTSRTTQSGKGYIGRTN